MLCRVVVLVSWVRYLVWNCWLIEMLNRYSLVVFSGMFSVMMVNVDIKISLFSWVSCWN